MPVSPGDPVDDAGVRARCLRLLGAAPLAGVAGVAHEHERDGDEPAAEGRHGSVGLGLEEGGQARCGRGAADGLVVDPGPAQPGVLEPVGEGRQPAPALERPDVTAGIRAGQRDRVVVAGHGCNPSVELPRGDHRHGLGNADDRQAGDLRREHVAPRRGGRRRRASGLGRRGGGSHGGRRGGGDRRGWQSPGAGGCHDAQREEQRGSLHERIDAARRVLVPEAGSVGVAQVSTSASCRPKGHLLPHRVLMMVYFAAPSWPGRVAGDGRRSACCIGHELT
jgi:hypothetical protein